MKSKREFPKLESKIDEVKRSEKALLDLFDTAAKLGNNLESEFRFGTSLSNAINQAVQRTEAAAKQLGVNPSNISEIKQVFPSLQQELEKALQKAEQTLKAYRSL
jgi:flavin-binding protein dodecin